MTAIQRKPGAFKYTGFFKDLPTVWQEYFNKADYDDSRKMLNVLTPIILDGKLPDATIAMEIGEISTVDEFLVTYRSLTEPPRPKQVTSKNTPQQQPYKKDLSVYKDLIGGAE